MNAAPRSEAGRLARAAARWVAALWLLLVLAVAACGLALISYGARYAERIYEGVNVMGIEVGGLTQEEALRRLQVALSARQLPYVSLTTLERDWTLSAGDLGAELALRPAVQEAWRLGREGVFRHDLVTRLRLLWQGYRVMPALTFDPGRSLIALQGVARQAGHPAQRAQLWVAGLQARAGDSQIGRELDIESTRRDIEQACLDALGASHWEPAPRFWGSLYGAISGPAVEMVDPLSVALAFHEILPPLTEVSGAQERVSAILGGPLILNYALPEIEADGTVRHVLHRRAVDEAVLSSWLTLGRAPVGEDARLRVELDRAEIRAHLERLADEIARPPREARFDYDPKAQRLTTLAPGQNGYVLDVAAATERVAQAALAGQRAVDLAITVIPPRVSRADLEALLPLELIGEGESGFAGSTAGRLQNIKTASARFHGVAVAPHSVFSFVSHLGLVTAANGYSESWIIYGNRTLLGPGGGVCQVGTTFFRAAFWSGYPIVERTPHAYRVGWYEPPVGLDAAVYHPSVDVKFDNDSPTPILILTEVDEARARLVFRFYGRGVGRRVTIEGPTLANSVPAGAPVYEEDPLLAPGQRVQVEQARDGVDATLYRVIEQNGRVVARERFFSRYQPWPARYRVGPGTATAQP
jgi:vancomycin resistance protein YoaR